MRASRRYDHAIHAVLPTFTVALSLGSCEPHGGDKVTRPALVYQGASERSIDADAPPTTIRDTTTPRPAPPAATVPADRGYLQRFADPARDSRLGVRLAATPYKPRWQAALQEAPPLAVLTAGDRAVIEARDGWQLFGLDGKSLARGAHADDTLVLDPANGVFYASHPSGMYAGYALADGKLAFAFATRQSAGFHRELIARRGTQILLASIEQPVMAQTMRRPELSLLEWQDLGAPMKVDPRGAVTTAREGATLFVRTVPIVVALGLDALVVAAQDRVIFAEPITLKVTKQLTGEFTPLTVSVDEASHAYLVVRSARGAALWIVAPSGDRMASVDLPPEIGAPEHPPVIGFHHEVYLIASQRVVTLGPDGKPAWTATLDAAIVGAVALPGGELLVTAGSDVVALGPSGERRLVHHFDGVGLATAAVLTAKGELLVASDRQLYCLAP